MSQPHTQTPIAASIDRQIHRALTGHRQAGKSHAEAMPEKLLLTAAEAAALLGMSLRQFHNKRPTLPEPVALGPRHIRWKRSDLVQWVADLTSAGPRQEPAQLKAGKAARKGTPGAPAEERGSPSAEAAGTRDLRRSEVPSNPGAADRAAAGG